MGEDGCEGWGGMVWRGAGDEHGLVGLCEALGEGGSLSLVLEGEWAWRIRSHDRTWG